MQLWGMIVEQNYKTYPPEGGDVPDKIYANILKQPMKTDKYKDFITWKTAQEVNGGVILIELTEDEYNIYEANNRAELFIDGRRDLPRWQYHVNLEEIGHFEDIEDDTSTWYKDIPVPEVRFKLSVKHNTDLTMPDSESDFPNEIKLDQGDKTVGQEDNRVAVRFEVRAQNNNLVGNGRYEFYNGTTPTSIVLSGGIGTMYIDTSKAHRRTPFNSNHKFYIDNNQRCVNITIFSKQIND